MDFEEKMHSNYDLDNIYIIDIYDFSQHALHIAVLNPS